MSSLLNNPSYFAKEFLKLRGHAVHVLAHQEKILRSVKRYLVIRCGRQIGKTLVICIKAVHYAFTNPHKRILIIAPSQRQSSRMFKIIRGFIYNSKYLKRSIDHSESQTQTEINLTNGVTILCLPAHPDTIRGESGDLVIIDEAAFVEDDIYYETIEPMTASTGGMIWLISTPKGKRGFFYHASRYANEKKYNWTEFFFPSEVATKYIREDTGKPQIDPDFLKTKKETLPDHIYRQEYGAEFIEARDNYFTTELIQQCVRPILQLNKGIENRTYYLGSDLAKKQDKFVVIIMEVIDSFEDDGKNYAQGEVVYTLHLEGATYHKQVRIIKDLMERFNIAKAWIDRTGVGEMPYEALKELRIEGVTMSLPKKETLYSNLRLQMERQAILFPPVELLLKELKELRYEYTVGGSHMKFFGEKFDDYPDALALVCQALMRKKSNISYYQSENSSLQVQPYAIVTDRGINISNNIKSTLKNLQKNKLIGDPNDVL